MDSYTCRVCGFHWEEKPWGEDGHSPTYAICPCCGVEWGNEDYCLESIRKFRSEWVGKGCQWFDIRQRPSDWDYQIQLRNVDANFI